MNYYYTGSKNLIEESNLYRERLTRSSLRKNNSSLLKLSLMGFVALFSPLLLLLWWPWFLRRKGSMIGKSIIAIGLLVLFGWVIDSVFLTKINPAWVSMKPLTALGFVLSGIYIAALNSNHSKLAELARIGSLFQLLFLVFLLLTIQLFDIFPFMEHYILFDRFDPVMTVKGGTPSIAVTSAFFMLIIAGTFQIFNYYRPIKFIGIGLMGAGLVGILGYILNEPILYYYLPNVSTAAAFHTCLGVALTGLGLYKAS